MGILYSDETEDIVPDSESNTIVCDVPVERPVPMFIIRQGKARRSRHRSAWRSLPLYLSFSDLSDDADIARLISPSISHTPTIQHLDPIASTHLVTDMHIPQSLPPASAFASAHLQLDLVDNTPISLRHQHAGDWTFINTPRTMPGTCTPVSEPETWILIDDS